MQFFAEQAQARQRSKFLLYLFGVLVVSIVVIINLVAHQVWVWIEPQQAVPYSLYLINSSIVILLTVGGAWVEMRRLQAGGTAVAEMAGGRRVQPNTENLQERRLLNVVEEMAIAAGIAVPAVYLLEPTESINAFAAGHDLNDVAIAITRGALLRLNRDELQGVVAHEFSHILNGDMALNIRLIGLIFGLQIVAEMGRFLLASLPRNRVSRHTSREQSGLFVVWLIAGVSLFVLGWLGYFFGRILQACVSRQREYLADASAVQFTRQPDGIGGALRKIAGLGRAKGVPESGSFIKHSSSPRLAHLYLGPVLEKSWLGNWLATHPPLDERVRRVYGRSMSYLEAPPQQDTVVLAPEPAPTIPYLATPGVGLVAALSAPNPTVDLPVETDIAERVGQPVVMPRAVQAVGDSQKEIGVLLAAAREPYAARALVYAMLWSEDKETQARQSEALAKDTAAIGGETVETYVVYLRKLSPALRLPLLDVAAPAVRLLPVAYQKAFLQCVAELIAADKRLSLQEFVLQAILESRLERAAGNSPKPSLRIRNFNLGELNQEIRVIFNLLARTAMTASADNSTEQLCQSINAGLNYLNLAPQSTPLAFSYLQMRDALFKLKQLAPLQQPLLLRACVEVVRSALGLTPAAPSMQDLPIACADLLRMLCVAINCPLPPQVEAVYAQYAAHLS